ncbi:MAG: DUF421 domain-containing protein [Defluviitaleaceae bacterium]|nr:DUF421 domain-containing protein [Defluviitaleaceae bacterium]
MLDKVMQTAVSSAIAIITLFVLTRLLGKKQMAQLNFFDYVIGITIGSIASEYAVVRDIHMAEGLTALIVVTLFSVMFSYLSIKSYWCRKILDGSPVILIENGKILNKNLQKVKLNINDLLEECRQKNFFDIADINFAILETSGKLSILPKSQSRPLTPRDIKIPTINEDLCTNVIIDGKIIKEHLKSIYLNENLLYTELARQGIDDIDHVLLAYIDTTGVLHTHIKNNDDSDIRFLH